MNLKALLTVAFVFESQLQKQRGWRGSKREHMAPCFDANIRYDM